MRRLIAIGAVTILLGALACSMAMSADPGDVWLGNFFLLRFRTAAGGYTIDQRADALQMRANNLLELEKISTITARLSGSDVNIYTNGKLFLTATSADAKANDTTVEDLANSWVQRLIMVVREAAPEKLGVGLPSQPSMPEPAP